MNRWNNAIFLHLHAIFFSPCRSRSKRPCCKKTTKMQTKGHVTSHDRPHKHVCNRAPFLLFLLLFYIWTRPTKCLQRSDRPEGRFPSCSCLCWTAWLRALRPESIGLGGIGAGLAAQPLRDPQRETRDVSRKSKSDAGFFSFVYIYTVRIFLQLEHLWATLCCHRAALPGNKKSVQVWNQTWMVFCCCWIIFQVFCSLSPWLKMTVCKIYFHLYLAE